MRDRKGEYLQVFEDVRKAGFVRVRVDGEIRDVDDEIKLDRYKQHTIEVVVDRLVVPEAVSGDDERDRSGRWPCRRLGRAGAEARERHRHRVGVQPGPRPRT